MSTETIYFGRMTNFGSEFPFGIEANDARRHIHVIGQTGSGKTTLLRNSILQHISVGHGVALLDPHGDATVRAAAEGFLSSWVTQPVDDPYPDELAFAWRVKLYRDLTGLPEPVIANPAGWIVERAEKRATEKRAIAAK